MDYDRILREIHQEVTPALAAGKVADYIPKLASVPADRFGMAVHTLDGDIYTIGDAGERFSIQSISKVYTLTLALKFIGEEKLLAR
ncbi:MAG: glutaminase, partial [Desulfobacterales bacterium]|nr:glutaminase [Desulfobacterales bacterium]